MKYNYDSNIGDCKYEAPDGIIKGKLLLKRQYKYNFIVLGHTIKIFSSDRFLLYNIFYEK